MDKIEFKNCEVQSLLNDFYIVPDYQREYVWTETNIKELLNDLYLEFNNKNRSLEYFLGTIVVCKNDESKKFEIIDGQQRLITLSIILSVIRKIYGDIGEDCKAIDDLLFNSKINQDGNPVDSFTINVEYEGKEVFYKILKQEQINVNDISGSPGSTFFEAYEAVEDFFRENFDLNVCFDKIKSFVGHILNNIKIIRIETQNFQSALKIFETINDRGVRLDQVDLTKNLIFRQVGREDFSQLKNGWNKFRSEIQGNEVREKPLRFMRYFIISNYEMGIVNNDEDEIIREDNIYQWFIDNESQCKIKKNPFAFTEKLYSDAEFYMGLVNDKFYDNDNLYLKNIKALVGNAFKQHYILLLAAKKMDKKMFNHFAAQLETLLFYYTLTKELPRDIEKRFVKWASELQKIDNIDKLNNFIRENLINDINNRKNKFRNNFIELKYTDLQKYKLKYILAKLDEYVERVRVGDERPNSLDQYLKSNINIEHILPDKPTNDTVRDFCGGNQKEYDSYKVKIGNLALLEQPINKSIKRDEFNHKVTRYVDSNFYLTRSISKLDDGGNNTSITRINKDLKEFKKWDKSTIDDRTQILYSLAEKVWNIELI